jgi:hypothetical protein
MHPEIVDALFNPSHGNLPNSLPNLSIKNSRCPLEGRYLYLNPEEFAEFGDLFHFTVRVPKHEVSPDTSQRVFELTRHLARTSQCLIAGIYPRPRKMLRVATLVCDTETQATIDYNQECTAVSASHS